MTNKETKTMTRLNFETLTIDTRDEAEGDLAAAENLGHVTIYHDRHGAITIDLLSCGEFIITTDETNLRYRANDAAALDLLFALYEGRTPR